MCPSLPLFLIQGDTRTHLSRGVNTTRSLCLHTGGGILYNAYLPSVSYEMVVRFVIDKVT
jgi:hypothetical protein